MTSQRPDNPPSQETHGGLPIHRLEVHERRRMRSTPIVGIDPSVKSTGLAWPDGTTDTIRPPATLRGGDRLRWIERHLSRLLRLNPPTPRVAIIEGYSHGGPGGPTVMLRLGEVGGIIRLVLARHDTTVVEIPPARLKRWATGNGRADKDAMCEALPRGVSIGMDTDDEVDAFWLWHLGEHGINGAPLDSNDPRHRARLDVLANIDWPTP